MTFPLEDNDVAASGFREVISKAGANNAAPNDDYIRRRAHVNQFSRGCIYGLEPGKLPYVTDVSLYEVGVRRLSRGTSPDDGVGQPSERAAMEACEVGVSRVVHIKQKWF